jgi:UDP-N-acetylglucosamine--N-acetylmuramyl-(pentapeptide) pyrophosphoryl-undecaprenol N-acetylglucosamine transferase
MSTTLLSYAVNGVGLGHVQRQLGIHAWLRRLGGACGVSTQHAMITTSEASHLADDAGVATFKLPSKSGIERAGFDKLSYLALAKQWSWTALSTLRPEIFIVDTFAAGSFHELPAALDLARQRVLVYRPAKDVIAARPEFIAAAQQYDLIVVPAAEEFSDDVARQLRVPPSRLRMVGPVMRHERFESLDRTASRQQLGVVGDAMVVALSFGGGGDDTVDASLDAAQAAIEAAVATGLAIHTVIAAGPLYRGRPRRGPTCTWLTDAAVPLLWAGVDVAISAAGYNSVHELAFAGVPTLVWPQQKVADDQHARAHAMAESGAAMVVDGLSLPSQLMALLMDEGRRQQMSAAARQWMPHNHADAAAHAILELLVPASTLAAARESLTDDVIVAVEGSSLAWNSVRELALTLAPHADDVDVPLHEAVALLRKWPSLGPQLTSLGRALHKRTSNRERVAERVAALEHVMQHAVPGAALAALQSLSWDRPPDAMAIAKTVVARALAAT